MYEKLVYNSRKNKINVYQKFKKLKKILIKLKELLRYSYENTLEWLAMTSGGASTLWRSS